MGDGDKRSFRDLLLQTGEFYERIPTAMQMVAWWEDLNPYPIDIVISAFKAHRRDPLACQFMPKPGQIIGRIEAAAGGSGWPTADEAWALVPKTEDESAVWTDEMAQAWFDSESLMPDQVAARMAFKGSYERRIAAAKASGQRPAWMATLGHDKAQREPVLDRAVQMGRIGQDVARSMLPPPDIAGVDMKQLENSAQATGDSEDKRKALALIGLLIARNRTGQGKSVREYAVTDAQRALMVARGKKVA